MCIFSLCFKWDTVCRILCQRRITISECELAHEIIIQFCNTFEMLYGKEHITINMHLMCHLLQCCKDYGPIYSCRRFPFERFNGNCGSYPFNNHNIAITTMKKFQDSMNTNSEVLYGPERVLYTTCQELLLVSPQCPLNNVLSRSAAITIYLILYHYLKV